MIYKSLEDNIRKTQTEQEWLEKLYKIKDYNVRDVNEGNTPLTISAYYGHIEGCKHILNNGGDINMRNKNGETPIHCAINAASYYGDNTFLFLLDQGADINIADNDGVTPLMEAMHNNLSNELIQILIDKGANVNATNKWDMTSLMYAAQSIQSKDITIYKKLLEKGADPLCIDEAGCNALFYLVKEYITKDNEKLKATTEELIELLPQDKAALNVLDVENGNSILYHAAANGYLKLVKTLIKHNVDINLQNKEGETPIIRATKRKQEDVIDFLLSQNADVSLKDNENETVITIAQKYANQDGDKSIEQLLHKYNIELPLKLGEVDVNEVDKKGNSALHLAVKEGSVEKVKELIERGANVNLQNKQGKTALMLTKWFDKIELLIKNGANVNLQDNYGKTVLIYLMDDSSYDYTDTVRNIFNPLMSVKNIDVNLQTKIGMTALMYVCKVHSHSVAYYAKALIDRGAKIGLATKKGKTALSFADQWDEKLIELLKSNKDG